MPDLAAREVIEMLIARIVALESRPIGLVGPAGVFDIDDPQLYFTLVCIDDATTHVVRIRKVGTGYVLSVVQ